MKSKLTLMVAMAMACAAVQLTAMPTEEEARRAEPVVKKMLAQERSALAIGKKTRSEVADAAMKLADEADADAAKLLLMKGAFVLYVRDGKLEKAVETMKALKAAIADMPPQSVTNIIETALCGVSKENSGELRKLLDEAMKKHGDDLHAGLIALPVGSSTASNSKLYCVIDLSAGPNASNYPVSYLAAEPKGGWTDEYKTTKLVLRRIEPGKFKMRGQYEVTLTKPFYCGVFEVTQKQYELVTGNNPSKFKGDMRPVEMVSWNIIRGDSSKYNWPSSANVDSATFIGKIQARTGLSFDLPTEAQWEYACRAGATSKFNNGGNSEIDLKKLGRFTLNQKERGWCGRWETDTDLARHEPDGKGGCWKNHTVVGSYQPNAWGLYDMHGNVWEWCLDWWRGDLSSGVTDTDPQGSSSGSERVFRGGSWLGSAHYCASSYWYARIAPSHEDDIRGFRLCMNPEDHAAPNVEYKFSYKLEGDNAVITGIDPKPVGTVVIPDKIDGHLVTAFQSYPATNPFQHSDRVAKIVLPAGMNGETFDPGVFTWCKSLSSIEVSKENKDFASRDGVLYSKDFSTLFVYPKTRESVKLSPKTRMVKKCAFRGCALKMAKIPEGITEMEGFNFSDCPNLEIVEFPKSITYLGCCVVGWSDNVKKIVFNGDAPRTGGWGGHVFAEVPSDLVVEVRRGTKGWKSPDSIELPERWPVNQSESRPIRYIGEEERGSVASILKGMIKVPGRDYWLSATELTQGQWEAVMGYNNSEHKGVNLPVECVSRDDCDVFLKKLNQTEEVKSSQFEFRLPELEEWKYAAWAGSAGHGSWIKPGVAGNVLDMAWVKANSSNQTHAVATKAPNAFGFYDMLGNVWEWLAGDAPGGDRGALKGCAFNQVADKCTWNQNWYMPKTQRHYCCGLRLAAHVRPQPALMTSGATEKTEVAVPKDLTGPYGIRMQPDPGCEKGAEYVLAKLRDVYLPCAVRYYGDPFGGKEPSRVYTLYVKRNDGKGNRGYTGPFWGSRGDGISQFTIGLAKGSDKWDMDLELVASKILTVCREDVGFSLYVNDFVRGDAKGIDPVPEIKEMIRKGLAKEGDEKKDVRLRVWRKYAPMWSVFEELRARHPNFMLDYSNLKNSRYAEGKLPQRLSFDQTADLLGEVTGENMAELFKKYGVGRRESQKYPLPKISVAQTLQSCDFLLNKDFKKNAKYYLCLFSASWCGPCRAEMPRIAKTYAETLKDDPNIELIHFSRDQNDEKALAWAKEHDVKFPVVKPNGGNPLDLQTSGIPHLFIVKADGTLIEEGHPMKLFTDEKLRELKVANGGDGASGKAKMMLSGKEMIDGVEWTYSIKDGKAQLDYVASSNTTGAITIPSTLGGCPVTSIRGRQYGQPDVFGKCSKLTSVTIPSSVTSIGERAFESCRELRTVTIPSSVTSIGSFAFFGCNSLVSVVIPSGVTSIGYRAFDFCSGLASVTIPASVKRIEREAFSSCGKLMSISVDSDNPSYSSRNGLLCSKDGHTLIAGVNGAVTIPSGVTYIGESAFQGCGGLTSVTIPSSVTSIGERAFAMCRGLRSVTIPSSVTSIGGYAFNGCTRLASVTIPNSVTCIGSGVFWGTSYYNNMPDGVVVLGGGVLCGYKGKRPSTVMISSNVTSIAGEAFSERFRSLRRPGLNSGAGLNNGAGLKMVVISSSVTNIGNRVFSCCGNLTNVTMRGERPEAPKDIFQGCDKLKAILVPANAKSWAGMKEWLGIPLVFDAK